METEAAILIAQKKPLIIEKIKIQDKLKIGQVLVELYVRNMRFANWRN